MAIYALALFATLSAPVQAIENQQPAQITEAAVLPDMPSTLVVDESFNTVTDGHIMKSHAEELRLRHRYIHRQKRQKDADEDSDDAKTDKGSKSATQGEDEDEDDDDKTTRRRISEPTKTGDETDKTASSTASASSTDEAETSSVPLPVPFDGTPSSEFNTLEGDNSCPSFMSSLLNSETFNDCYPLSMMVTKSASFFKAKRSLTNMVRTLDKACDVDVEACASFMATAASNLTSEDNCKDEFDQGVTVVIDAYQGLMNYEVMYQVSCLEDEESGQYCYANAVTNTSNSSDSYIYFLPYDLDLPGPAVPNCNWCNQETLDIFHAASANRDLGIANTYEEAARLINNLCEPEWVNGTMPEAVESWATNALPAWGVMAGSIALVGTIGSFL
jgi:hypothetical protein